MKLRTVLTLALCLAFFSSSASAALIAFYRQGDASNANPTPGAFDYHDDVQTPSTLAGHGSVFRPFSASGLPYAGYTSVIDGLNYVGFSISVLPGHQLELTNLQFGYFNLQNITEVRAGYRIDNGSGFGNWTYSENMGTDFFNFDENFIFAPGTTTTGTVEIGFFAVGTNPDPNQNGFQFLGDIQLNGNVTPVPEPSTATLGTAFVLAVCSVAAAAESHDSLP